MTPRGLRRMNSGLVSDCRNMASRAAPTNIGVATPKSVTLFSPSIGRRLSPGGGSVEPRLGLALDSSPVALLLLEPLRDTRGRPADFTCTYANSEAARILGRE